MSVWGFSLGGYGSLGSRAALARGRIRESSGRLGIHPGGACGGGGHVEGGGGDLLGMAGLSLGAQNGGVDNYPRAF